MKRHLFLAFFSAAILALSGVARAGSVTIDLRPPEEAAIRRPAGGLGASCLRAVSLPRGAAAADELSVGDTLTFRLFRDTEIRVTLASRMESPLGGEVFLGEAEGCGGVKNAVVLQTAEGLTVDIQDFRNGRVWSIVPDADGVTVRELDPSADHVVPSAPVAPGPSAGKRPESRAAGDQASTVLDVLVAYDTPAAEWVRRNGGGTTNFATMAVQKMNTVLENNGLAESFRFRLVGVAEVAAEGGSDFGGVLDAVRTGGGEWAPIKARRDEVGADVVTTLIDTGSASGTTGLGYSLESEPVSAFSEWAFNVCAVRAVAQNHTMTHETGHNLGAGHASAVDPSQIAPGPQLYSYSSGYHFTGNDGVAYHTIMAYYHDGFGNTYVPVPFFSSPDRIHAGTPVGDAGHDNERTLRATLPGAVQWRAQKVPLSYDVLFEPAGGATFGESITVALAPGKAGLPVRYTLDGSEPTLDSPLYDTPLVLTATTTIRAAVVTDGILGPVFEATYSLSDLGAGLDAPQLAWRTSETRPWTFQTTDTCDGVDAVQSDDDGGYWTDDVWLETTVAGPTDMSFRYKMRTYWGTFSVLVDGIEAFSDRRDVASDGWHLAEISIPGGTHAVRFVFACDRGRYNGYNGVWLDTVRFDALSRPPSISPATTGDPATATIFRDRLEVSIAPPEGRTGSLLYTLDGSDPAGDAGLPYAGPFELTASARVRAVFVEAGKDPSIEVAGIYLERHPVAAGEWTTDVEGAKTAAARDGRLIAVLCANRAGCWWSRQFYSVAESPGFLAWAGANGIYLVTSDESCHIDAAEAYSWFRTLRSSSGDSGNIYYPTLYFALPSAPETAVGKGLARNDGESAVGTEPYLGTVESLVAGFASVLGETAPRAPVVLPQATLVAAFPLSVTLSTPDGSGTILYTLDGTPPSRGNGLPCDGPLAIPDGPALLQAAVWPVSGVSSPVFMGTYKSVADVLGTDNIAWSLSGSGTWREEAGTPGTLRAGGLRTDAYEATLRATVQGKGKLVFAYDFSTWTTLNTFTFTAGGERQWLLRRDASGTVTNEVDASGPTDFEWTCTVEDPSCDYGEGYSAQAGVWLSGIRWIPDEQAVLIEGVPVPFAWLDRHYPGQAATEADRETLARSDTDADGYPAWQEYLLGTDPTDPASRLLAAIRMDGAVPVFTWSPSNADLGTLGYRYVPVGRPSMTGDSGWQPFTPAHPFFAVSVQPIH